MGFYANYDVSARVRNGVLMPNTLGDLTRRECRFAHNAASPYDCNWYWTVTGSSNHYPTLPTLYECSQPSWNTEATPGSVGSLSAAVDFWTNTSGHRVLDNALGTTGTRVADDVILTNVIGFDVQAWDPTAQNAAGGVGAYVDLGYLNQTFAAATYRFSHLGDPRSGLAGSATTARVYDTYSTHYEALAGTTNNGLDDNSVGTLGYGIVDDDAEKTYAPPYPYPLRGIQVKIRVFEPDSRQIREVTVVQDFLPQ